MKILGLEFSTRKAGLVVMDGDQVLAEALWEEARAQHEALFQNLPRLLDQAGLSIADIDLFAVGRGPGAFSGVRVALTAARAFALPFGKPVYAVSSGEALAAAAVKDTQPVAVIGDARRGSVWLGIYVAGGDGLTCVLPWTVVAAGDAARAIPSGARILSPDAERLAGLNLGIESAFPTARQVVSHVQRRKAEGVPSDAPEPLYMHPPV